MLVAAPTGAGKTVLADYVIEQTLKRHQRVIYTSPIKALSNQKFRDFFARYGSRADAISPSVGLASSAADIPDKSDALGPARGSQRQMVGIMTGDVTLNPQAPLIIMTTEIYRNTLLEDPERLSSYAWIIFDEIHYLDDPQRGTVWEEAILFSPRHIRLLCLSATIPNVSEIATWIREIHQRPIEVIQETQRPVPLHIRFQCQNRIMDSLQQLQQEGYSVLASDSRPLLRHAKRLPYSQQRRLGLELRYPNRVQSLVHTLEEEQHLPCIWFTFGRRNAENLAWEISRYCTLEDPQRERLLATYRKLCNQFQLNQHPIAEALGQLIGSGVAYHHAGMMPTVKEVIERCFTSRQLKVIVTTETFALGINMPARSVVLDTLKKRLGSTFELLRRRQFLQMAGRAGRRGMDDFGVAYVRVNPLHVTCPEVQQLIQGSPEPVYSRFNMTYATLLNLHRRHGAGLLDIFPKTLYYFQTSGMRQQEGLSLIQRKLQLLTTMGYINPDGLTPKGAFACWLYGYELLLTELHIDGELSHLDPLALAIVVLAVVYEPRPNVKKLKRHRLYQRLNQLCQEPLGQIHKEENRLHIRPKTKVPAFHLSAALEVWFQGGVFHHLSRHTEVDEGEIIRYFRMTVQLLRQLADSPQSDTRLRAMALKAIHRINRDVIDAEAQLQLG